MIQQLETVIQHGTVELSVPNGMSVETALSSYANNYPELAVAKLSEPETIGEKIVYKVVKNEKIGTKG